MHVKAVHRAHFSAELAADDDVGVDAAFVREHHKMVFEVGCPVVNDGKVNPVRLVFKNANEAGVQMAGAAAIIVVKRAFSIFVAGAYAIEVVRQLLAKSDNRGRAEIVKRVFAKGHFEQAIVEDERFNVARLIVANFGWRIIE